jgi:hypothetical protein
MNFIHAASFAYKVASQVWNEKNNSRVRIEAPGSPRASKTGSTPAMRDSKGRTAVPGPPPDRRLSLDGSLRLDRQRSLRREGEKATPPEAMGNLDELGDYLHGRTNVRDGDDPWDRPVQRSETPGHAEELSWNESPLAGTPQQGPEVQGTIDRVPDGSDLEELSLDGSLRLDRQRSLRREGEKATPPEAMMGNPDKPGDCVDGRTNVRAGDDPWARPMQGSETPDVAEQLRKESPLAGTPQQGPEVQGTIDRVPDGSDLEETVIDDFPEWSPEPELGEPLDLSAWMSRDAQPTGSKDGQQSEPFVPHRPSMLPVKQDVTALLTAPPPLPAVRARSLTMGEPAAASLQRDEPSQGAVT